MFSYTHRVSRGNAPILYILRKRRERARNRNRYFSNNRFVRPGIEKRFRLKKLQIKHVAVLIRTSVLVTQKKKPVGIVHVTICTRQGRGEG